MKKSAPAEATAFVLRAFNDAGTGESFAARAVVTLAVGRFENFRVAGLVRKATAAEIRAARAR